MNKIIYAFIALSVVLSSCKKSEEIIISTEEKMNFRVDIPTSIRNTTAKRLSSTNNTLDGNDIYGMLGVFVDVGDNAAQIVQEIIWAINVHNLNQATSTSFIGDDGNNKDLEVVVGTNYDWELTVTDNISGNNALQVFWNGNSGNGVEGFSIINMYELDNNNGAQFSNTNVRIDYSEVTSAYDAQMLVQISDWPVSANSELNNLKMFVGKTNDIIDVYGNSNHPGAYIVDSTHQDGYNWAFRAHSNEVLNIAVAEVGLPTTIHNDSLDIFSYYSIHNSLKTEIDNFLGYTYPTAPSTYIDSISDAYLVNAIAPGYFTGAQGFVASGVAPTSNHSFLNARMTSIDQMPYVPFNINSLIIPWQ
jgi:hypothetical protein